MKMSNASPLFLSLCDSDRYLSDDRVVAIETKASEGKFNKLSTFLTALAENPSIVALFPPEAKERCVRLLPIYSAGLTKQQISPEVVFKALEPFATCGLFQSTTLKEEIFCVGSDGSKIPINRHLLLIHSPTATTSTTPPLSNEATGVEILLPNASPKVLHTLKGYIYHRYIPDDLSVEDCTMLLQLTDPRLMHDLCQKYLSKVKESVCTQHAEQHTEMLYQFLKASEGRITEEQKNHLACVFVSTVLFQNGIAFEASSQQAIGMRFSEIYLLNQKNSFAYLLKCCVRGFYHDTEKNLDDSLYQIAALPKKVKESIEWLDMKEPIPSEQLQKLLSHLPNIRRITLTIEPTDDEQTLNVISKAPKLFSVRIEIPLRIQLQEVKSSSIIDTISTKIQSLTISNKPTCLHFPLEFVEALSKKITSFTLNQQCDIILIGGPKDIDTANKYAQSLSKRFSQPISAIYTTSIKAPILIWPAK